MGIILISKLSTNPHRTYLITNRDKQTIYYCSDDHCHTGKTKISAVALFVLHAMPHRLDILIGVCRPYVNVLSPFRPLAYGNMTRERGARERYATAYV